MFCQLVKMFFAVAGMARWRDWPSAIPMVILHTLQTYRQSYSHVATPPNLHVYAELSSPSNLNAEQVRVGLVKRPNLRSSIHYGIPDLSGVTIQNAGRMLETLKPVLFGSNSDQVNKCLSVTAGQGIYESLAYEVFSLTQARPRPRSRELADQIKQKDRSPLPTSQAILCSATPRPLSKKPNLLSCSHIATN